MARIRTIKPEFPQSESMGRISREARLCFILLWTVVDDAGRARASSRLLASLLYPYDGDAAERMEGWLAELETERCIDRYCIDGNAYLQIGKWLNHQKIDRPSASRIPEFDESSRALASPRVVSDADLGPRTVVPVPRTVDLPPAQTAVAVNAERGKVVGTMPVIAPVGEHDIYEGDERAWIEAFPGINVRQELRKCKQWCCDNPRLRKTRAGVRRFINAWLSRAQDDAGKVGAGVVRGNHHPRDPGVATGLPPPTRQQEIERWRVTRKLNPNLYAAEAPEWAREELEAKT